MLEFIIGLAFAVFVVCPLLAMISTIPMAFDAYCELGNHGTLRSCWVKIFKLTFSDFKVYWTSVTIGFFILFVILLILLITSVIFVACFFLFSLLFQLLFSLFSVLGSFLINLI